LIHVGQVWTHKGVPWQVVAIAGKDVSLQSWPPAHPPYNRMRSAHGPAMELSADWHLVQQGEAVEVYR
jgi:hypothetical protein